MTLPVFKRPPRGRRFRSRTTWATALFAKDNKRPLSPFALLFVSPLALLFVAGPGAAALIVTPALKAASTSPTTTTPSPTTATMQTVSLNDATTGTGTNQFEFGGFWKAGADSRAYQGDEHYSNLAGNYVQVRFSGTQVQLSTTKDPWHGIQAVSIDGGRETRVDLYAPTRANQVYVYTSPLLTDGPHTLKVRVTGAKNANAAGSYIVVDRIDVASSAVASGWTNVIDTDFSSSGALPYPWQAYNFANSQPSAGYYLPSHVVVSGGIATLRQKYEASGPARNWYYGSNGAGWYQGTIYAPAPGPWNSIDHRTTFRMRILSTNGITSHRNLPLRWPLTGTQPAAGEENYLESDPVLAPPVGSMQQPYAFFHFGSGAQSVRYVNFDVLDWPMVDFSQWHTYRVERRNHQIRIWIDDLTTPVVQQQWSSWELPDTQKVPVFQQENANYVPPAGTTGSEEIQIDWITVDAPS